MHLALLPTGSETPWESSARGLANRPSDQELIERIARAEREAMSLLFPRGTPGEADSPGSTLR